MAASVELKNVTKSFGANPAISEVTLSVKAGEVLVLVGPSGCGKSTILNLVAGLTTPTAGQVLVNNKPVEGPSADRGFIFQDGGLFPWLNALKNVEFGLRQAKVPADERRERALAMLDRVGLAGKGERFLHELSGGMRQRVAIARSLVLSPQVLLMDEPFSALDALTREDMYGLLQELWQQSPTTVLFVTHNVREAATLGDQIVLFTGSPGSVQQSYEMHAVRPRAIDDPEVSYRSREISADLKLGPIPPGTQTGADI